MEKSHPWMNKSHMDEDDGRRTLNEPMLILPCIGIRYQGSQSWRQMIYPQYKLPSVFIFNYFRPSLWFIQ